MTVFGSGCGHASVGLYVNRQPVHVPTDVPPAACGRSLRDRSRIVEVERESFLGLVRLVMRSPCGFDTRDVDVTTLANERQTRIVLAMHGLECSIHLDAKLSQVELLALVAELTGGVRRERRVELAWGYILADDDFGDFFVRERDPDDFLGWRALLEIIPDDLAARDVVVAAVADLIRGLRARDIRTVTLADYVDELPGGDGWTR